MKKYNNNDNNNNHNNNNLDIKIYSSFEFYDYSVWFQFG